jgi:type I restriction-modification system DNA methylase subunit
MTAPDSIKRLVDTFHEQRESYTSGAYNETATRREFIDPFFKALGWDIDNEKGYAESFKEVVHEDAIKIGGATKAPDYSFRVGGRRIFFVEAKKPSVRIKDEIPPAYQVRRYAWSAKLPLSILTDFEEFALYDTRIKPDPQDKASVARILYLTYEEYLDRWDELYDRFSYDAVVKGRFDKYAASARTKKGTTQVDDAFLKEIEGWRESLAKTIALRNKSLSQEQLNFAVQRIVDRIIFLRICEDRGIEPVERLRTLQNGANVYERLLDLFRQADDRYNSGLFHFKSEKGRHEAPDELTLGLTLDDKPLKEIFGALYYPESPYEFSLIPADILGQVYERFLGKVIRLTAGHQAKVEEKPEVRKAGGVYYTPTYIVDYIVKQTVGALLEGKTPKQAASVTIVDPACGSGSFLLGAYQYLLDWYRDRYKESANAADKKRVYQTRLGEWRLTTDERKRILLTHIHGVDIDAQAVETTKLSLLLKTLEGESDESIRSQMKLLHERALPDLGDNIKCGNSLIGPDFYAQPSLPTLDEDETRRLNVFDWGREFPKVFKAGGFSAVIGNPPYVRQEGLGLYKEYFAGKYAVTHGTADLYVYFIEKGFALLTDGGKFAYIVANKWMRANYGQPLRRWMKEKKIDEIVDFGDLPVFQQATTYPCILRLANGKPAARFPATQVESLDHPDLGDYVRANWHDVSQKHLDDGGWSLTGETSRALLEKLKAAGVPLGEYVEGKVYRGVLTGLNEAFVIDGATRARLIREDKKSAELIKPFLAGRDIKRYAPLPGDRYLILIPKGWTRATMGAAKNPWSWLEKSYPAIAAHLAPHTKKGEKRYDKGEYWWELRSCDYYAEFEKPKIIVPAIVNRGSYVLDSMRYYSNDKTTIIPLDDRYLLGLLNSRLLDHFLHSMASTKQGGYYEYKPMYLVLLPIADAPKKKRDQIAALADTMMELHRSLDAAKTPHEKTALLRRIDATDAQIDRLVYDLYGLTDDEIALVEAATSRPC